MTSEPCRGYICDRHLARTTICASADFCYEFGAHQSALEGLRDWLEERELLLLSWN